MTEVAPISGPEDPLLTDEINRELKLDIIDAMLDGSQYIRVSFDRSDNVLYFNYSKDLLEFRFLHADAGNTSIILVCNREIAHSYKLSTGVLKFMELGDEEDKRVFAIVECATKGSVLWVLAETVKLLKVITVSQMIDYDASTAPYDVRMVDISNGVQLW